MYCHQCGAKAHGAFCSACGTKVITASSAVESPPLDWSSEIRYEVLLRVPEVRELIARYASQSTTRMSADEFLELCDHAVAPLVGVSLAKIAAIAQPIYATLGVKTGKMHRELLPVPAGRVLVATMCSLARRGRRINNVEQGEDGCLLKAELPSDLWSVAGEMLVTIERQEQGSIVEAATVIKGQLYDWGKSARVLKEFFDDIRGGAL